MNRIWAVSGFLGLSSDWDFLLRSDVLGVDPTDFLPEPEQAKPFDRWASRFNRRCFSEEHPEDSSILIGYSLGGRLALHALIDRPDKWDAAVIVSAHPGLKTGEERTLRLSEDKKWAELFKVAEWETLMNRWNSRGVFGKNRFQFERREQEYSRSILARTLDSFSLGRQSDLREAISLLSMPILWITGAEDTRFCELASDLRFAHPSSRKPVISEAGHRAPWDRSESFRDELHRFLIDVSPMFARESPHC